LTPDPSAPDDYVNRDWNITYAVIFEWKCCDALQSYGAGESRVESGAGAPRLGARTGF